MTTPNNGGAAKPRVNVGTIGHVDHRKTTLTAALVQVATMERRDRQIADSWNRHNTGDISTPRLLQMVQDDTGCDVSRVISGLVRVGILKPQEPQS